MQVVVSACSACRHASSRAPGRFSGFSCPHPARSRGACSANHLAERKQIAGRPIADIHRSSSCMLVRRWRLSDAKASKFEMRSSMTAALPVQAFLEVHGGDTTTTATSSPQRHRTHHLYQQMASLQRQTLLNPTTVAEAASWHCPSLSASTIACTWRISQRMSNNNAALGTFSACCRARAAA